MKNQILKENEFSDNVIVVCGDNELNYPLERFFKFVNMTAEEMTADMLIDAMPRLQQKKVSMIMLEGSGNIKKILNRSFELRKYHPDLQFILLIDEPNEAVNAQEHFSYVRFLHKSEVIERIQLLMGYIHMQTVPEHRTLYHTAAPEHHSIDRYI